MIMSIYNKIAEQVHGHTARRMSDLEKKGKLYDGHESCYPGDVSEYDLLRRDLLYSLYTTA